VKHGEVSVGAAVNATMEQPSADASKARSYASLEGVGVSSGAAADLDGVIWSDRCAIRQGAFV